ncbi:MAG TPA: TMEM14 family protein [Rhabdochlamydiaceae bacterium]|nr:TMEM14 family protein [Rhabdochlamydiaceae bacterium]
MNFAAWTTLIYGLIILIGGLMGHIKAQSRISLFTGLFFGLLLLLSSWALFKEMKLGVYGALVLTLALLCVFTWRYIETLKIFPPLVMGLISLFTLILLALNLKKHL